MPTISKLYFNRVATFLLVALLMLPLSVACAQPAETPGPPESPDVETPDGETPDGETADTPTEPAAKCPPTFARVDVTVAGDVSEPLDLDPADPVTVFLPRVQTPPGKPPLKRQVCWVVAGLVDGQTLHIQRKRGQDDLFPALERTVSPPRDTSKSGVPARKGTWTYELWITEGVGDQRLHYTDPEVIIRDEGMVPGGPTVDGT